MFYSQLGNILFPVWEYFLSIKVPHSNIVVEFNIFSTSKLRYYLHDVFLLFRRKCIFSAIHSIIDTHSVTKITSDSSSGFSHKIPWHIFI